MSQSQPETFLTIVIGMRVCAASLSEVFLQAHKVKKGVWDNVRMPETQGTTVSPLSGATLLRWYVFTTSGRKVVWAVSEAAARGRARAQGLTAEQAEPAPSP